MATVVKEPKDFFSKSTTPKVCVSRLDTALLLRAVYTGFVVVG